MKTIKNKKILIVDDEVLIVKAFKDYFEREGYEIETAFDGEEGIAKAKEFNPDLILLDIIMPKLDGISALKELKKNPDTKKIPVIMLTNLPDIRENIDKTFKAGSADYLIKLNYSLVELEKKIEKALEHRNTENTKAQKHENTNI